jgi:prepilin signal peptidase PulO-like enzyme (type II secretory pathway)
MEARMNIMPDLAFLTAGLAAGFGLTVLFGRLPPSWLTDYGETDLTAAALAQHRAVRWPALLGPALGDALVFWLGYRLTGLVPLLAIQILVGQILILIIMADFGTRIIPDQLVIALLPGGLLLWLLDNPAAPPGWLIGLLLRLLAGVLAGAILAACGWLAGKIMKREAMGMGDVKLLAACGWLVGLDQLPFLYLLSFLTAAFVAVPILLGRIRRPEQSAEIAFGPYIALATLLLLLCKDEIALLWQLYLGTWA